MVVKNSLLTLGGPRGVSAGRKGGFALPIAIALGLVMIAFAGASILVAQGDRNNAVQRRASGASILVSDGAVSRALVQLSNPNNGVLLNRNYDPIDPKTGRNYLGPDGKPKSGDETATALDEWTSYNPSGAPCFQQLGWAAPNIALTGTLGTAETYTIRAYRYDEQEQVGTLLVEGSYQGQSSLLAISLAIEPVLNHFPGLLLMAYDTFPNTGKIALRGRQVLGSKGNIYYAPDHSSDPTLTGNAKPADPLRPSYLSAIYASNTQDGATGDNVGGTIYACKLRPNIPTGIMGINVGNITTSQTLNGVGGTVTTLYQVDTIDLAGNDTLTVDTTGGPVRIDITHPGGTGTALDRAITLRNTAKILNIRTDGQPPKVGDLRIMIRGHSQVNLYDQTCIQNAFLYIPVDEVRLFTSGPGCPGGNNTNLEGVVWAERILSNKNNLSNRNMAPLTLHTAELETTVSSSTSGIAVPDDVTSLIDVLEYVNWPMKYKYGAIKNWQRVN